MYLKDKALMIVQKLSNLSLLIYKARVLDELDKENQYIRISSIEIGARTEQSQQ